MLFGVLGVGGLLGDSVSWAKVGARHRLFVSLGGCMETTSIGWDMMSSLAVVSVKKGDSDQFKLGGGFFKEMAGAMGSQGAMVDSGGAREGCFGPPKW